jgi:hypothetical protein
MSEIAICQEIDLRPIRSDDPPFKNAVLVTGRDAASLGAPS